MKRQKKMGMGGLFTFMLALTFNCFVGVFAASGMGYTPIQGMAVANGVGFAVPFAGRIYAHYNGIRLTSTTYLYAGVIKELWTDIIMEHFFQPGDFTSGARDLTAFCEYGVLHAANAGVYPTIYVNNTSWPLTPVQRVDTSLDLSMNTFNTQPTFITNVEAMQSAYDKMSSVVLGHKQALQVQAYDDCAYNWTPVGDSAYTPVFATTGTLVGTVSAVAGTLTITVTTGGGTAGDTWTGTIGSILLVATPVDCSGAGSSTTTTATDIKNAINSYTGTSGCTALSSSAIVTVTLPTSVGSTLNGQSTVLTNGGAVVSTTTAVIGGVTGLAGRRNIQLADVAKMQAKFNAMKAPRIGRKMVLCETHLQQLLAQDALLFKQFADLKEGQVLKVFGFEVYDYADMPTFNSTTFVKNAQNSAPASTDSDTTLFFCDSEVAKAMNAFDMFFQGKSPVYAADLIGFEMRFLALTMRQRAVGAIFSAAS